HTLSNYAEIQVKHLSLDIEVDFQQKMIKGFAVWSFKNTKGANQLILDTKDLQIDSIKSADGSLRNFSLGDNDAILGAALKIDLQKEDSSIQIFYSSSPNATALQWLSASQTFDK